MKKLVVNGGIPLRGSVAAAGSKNAALPVLFACLAVKGVSVIKKVPDIGDVRVAVEILKGFGALVTRKGSTLTVNTEELEYKRPSARSVSSIRASTYLIGACLSRFGVCHLQPFGGCNFSKRPIDLHIYAAECMGAVTEEDLVVARSLTPAVIRFEKASVGATVNALIMAASTNGRSEIYGAAKEPHIGNLIEFLRSAGANITVDEEKITVSGGALTGGDVTLIGDMIEAGTYLAAGLATGGDVRVTGVDPSELSPFISVLRTAGAEVEIFDDGARAFGRISKPLEVICAPYPAFPTDLQPIASALASLNQGGRIVDTVWRERFGYLGALSSFGAGYRLVKDTAYIYPYANIVPASVAAPDLRGGAACLLLALAANGESTVSNAEMIGRGYENLAVKLGSLGADVRSLACPRKQTD